jgi:serine/tyrosine/threonine adenylyltransferase
MFLPIQNNPIMSELKDTPTLGWNLKHTYRQLPEVLFANVLPAAVPLPKLAFFNTKLADELGFSPNEITHSQWGNWLSGNELPPGAEPLAQAYAGHQFGHFTMLGDGRAILLGEQLTKDGKLVDVQLKGSGKTPFSRGGDGKATYKAMLREYLISEAMHGLRIPSSRSLAVVRTGEPVQREFTQEGAVLTRIMSSHLRVGTFEYARQFQSLDTLEKLCDYAIRKHYPEVLKSENPVNEFLRAVMRKQIKLVANWWRVGFIHGVMNTDNTGIAGETYDYGPCAFMNRFDLKTVYSSIDRNSRYAFGNQPAILKWNLSCLAGALLPLIHSQEAIAIDIAKGILEEFDDLFNQERAKIWAGKLGFSEATETSQTLSKELLTWMQNRGADYTNTFLFLEGIKVPQEAIYQDPIFVVWYQKWQEAVMDGSPQYLKILQANNPMYIPRNHLVEEALDKAAFQKDDSLLKDLLLILQDPYQREEPLTAYLSVPDESFESEFQTFCGT